MGLLFLLCGIKQLIKHFWVEGVCYWFQWLCASFLLFKQFTFGKVQTAKAEFN
jgi:hypothetical protein